MYKTTKRLPQWLSSLPAVQETQEMWVWSLGWEDPLVEGMATHSSILLVKIPWTEESGELQSMGLQRVRHDWARTHMHYHSSCLLLLLLHWETDSLPLHHQRWWLWWWAGNRNSIRQAIKKGRMKTLKEGLILLPQAEYLLLQGSFNSALKATG